MRRNLKLVICITVSWMFVMVYYFQTTSMKVIYLFPFPQYVNHSQYEFTIPIVLHNVNNCVPFNCGTCVLKL